MLIFQPAEEGGAGGRAMLEDGLMERVRHRGSLRHAQHAGYAARQHFGVRVGGIMAASDAFDIVIEGEGGHAAMAAQHRWTRC